MDSNAASITSIDLALWGLPQRSLHLLREDLFHPEYGGNKWRKLRYNIDKAKHLGSEALLTFGGPWSNHLHATAAACRDAGLKSIGVVRGEAPEPWTATLRDCADSGMQLQFVSRAEYAEKDTDFFKAWLRDQHGRIHIVPEGGANFLGMQGCMEILTDAHAAYSDVCIAMGTGTTAAGLLLGKSKHQTVWGFPMVNGGDGLRAAVQGHLYWALLDEEMAEEIAGQLRLVEGAGRRGFAKPDPELLTFMESFKTATGVELDHVYTAKLVIGVLTAMKSGALLGTPLVIHSGGTQGNRGL